MANLSGYNFAYLDEQTKRMIRRAILKAVAIPGYQVPFGGREMPLAYRWGFRDADAVRLGNWWYPAYRQRDWRKRRVEGD